MRQRTVVAPSLLVVFALGCGSADDGLPRVSVEGEVTYEGKPVDSGSVTFLPGKGTTGPSASGAVKQGHYSIPLERGPVVGSYRVTVTMVPTGTVPTGPTKPGLTPENVSAETSQSFTFERTLQERTNRLDFALSAKQ